MGLHYERVSSSADLPGSLEKQDDGWRVLRKGWGDVSSSCVLVLGM